MWSNNFYYDMFGNSKKSGSSSFMPGYNLNHQYASLPSGTPSYSSNGNVKNDDLHSYEYDSEEKLCRLDNGAIVMTYDAFGRWVERYNASQNRYTQAVYAPDGSEVAVMNGGTLVSFYVSLPKGAKAVYGPSGLASYWHPDWLGTARLMTGPTHTILADLAFGAYGEQYQGPAVDSMYTGVAQAPEATDLRKFPARELSTIESRWLTPDPAGMAAVDITNPQSFNRYAYVLGNPLGLVDPTGLEGNVASLGACISNISQCKSNDYNLWEYAMYLAYGTLSARPDPFAYLPTFDSGSEYSFPYSDFGAGAPFGIGLRSGGGDNGQAATPSKACRSALKAANRSVAGVTRANRAWIFLQTAANANGIPFSLLAAIAVRESNFMNVQEKLPGGGSGPGIGVFQLTNQRGVSSAQAFNMPFAANYAAGMLSSNMGYLSGAFSFTSSQLLQATAASYNFGTGNISGNPNTIDVGTAGQNYGSTVVGMMACF